MSSDTVAHCHHRLRAAVVSIVVVVVVGVVAAGKHNIMTWGQEGEEEGGHTSLVMPCCPSFSSSPTSHRNKTNHKFNRTVAKSDGHTAVTSTAVEYYCTLVQVRDDMAGCTAGRPAQQAAPHAHARAHTKAAWLVTVVIGWADPLCWDGQLPVQSSPVRAVINKTQYLNIASLGLIGDRGPTLLSS